MAEQQPPQDAPAAPVKATSPKPRPDEAPVEVEMATLRVADVLHHEVILYGPPETDDRGVEVEGKRYVVTPAGTPVPAELVEDFMQKAGRAGASLVNADQELAHDAELAEREVSE